MIVDGVVQVAVAEVGAVGELARSGGVAVGVAVVTAGRAAEDFVAAAVGDVAELRDVDVDQVTGGGCS